MDFQQAWDSYQIGFKCVINLISYLKVNTKKFRERFIFLVSYYIIRLCGFTLGTVIHEPCSIHFTQII